MPQFLLCACEGGFGLPNLLPICLCLVRLPLLRGYRIKQAISFPNFSCGRVAMNLLIANEAIDHWLAEAEQQKIIKKFHLDQLEDVD